MRLEQCGGESGAAAHVENVKRRRSQPHHVRQHELKMRHERLRRAVLQGIAKQHVKLFRPLIKRFLDEGIVGAVGNLLMAVRRQHVGSGSVKRRRRAPRAQYDDRLLAATGVGEA